MLEAGAKVPEFSLKDLNGSVRSSASYLERGVTAFVLFKISCPVCQLALPFLDRISGTSTLQLVAISQDSAKNTERFNRDYGITMPTLLDDASLRVSNTFRIDSVPSIFVVEPNGIIKSSWAGFSKADMEALGSMAGVPIFQPNENVPLFRPG